jgi:DNA-binding NarL/FixJ family response regulator
VAIAVVLLADHALFREGVRRTLSVGGHVEIVGDAGTIAVGQAMIRALRPHVVVLERMLAGACTWELLADGRFLMLAEYARQDEAAESFRRGALGYASKRDSAAELIAAIRTVSEGRRYLAPDLPRSLLDPCAWPAAADPLRTLSSREREIFDLVLDGASNQDASRSLSISVKTVETHRAKINKKLRVHSPVDLLRFAVRRRLLG